MSDTSTDDKIHVLVRSVLEAVDARLEAVRKEVAALERRVARLERSDAEDVSTAATVHERLDDLDARLVALVAGASTPAGPSAVGLAPAALQAPAGQPSADQAPADLSQLSRPLFDHTHITTQVPIVPGPAIKRMTSLHGDGDGEIDIDRLSALLTERLGHLTLPAPPD